MRRSPQSESGKTPKRAAAQRVGALFQARIIDGHRIFAADSTRADLYELLVFRRAADVLPRQRQREIELLGFSTS